MSSFVRKALNTLFLISNYDRFLRSQYYSVDKIRELQLKKLKRIVGIAIMKVPYYKHLSKEIDLENFSFAELAKFPMVNKDIIRANQRLFLREDVNHSKLEWKTTSGSTGKPFATPKHYYSDALEGIIGYRAWSMGKNLIYRYRAKSLSLRSYSPGEGDPIYKYDWFRRYWYLSPYHINETYLHEYLEIIQKSKSSLLRGYPSSIYVFTLLLKKHSIKLPQIKTIICSSETLLPQYRNTIEEYWGIKVRDWYGLNERTVIVQQCWAGNYHNNDEYGYIELDENSQIVSTSLWNDIMPLIRYQTRDTAIPYEGDPYTCPCGRHLKIPFRGILGRSDDIIVRDDGTFIPSINFYTAMEPFQLIDQFKLVQQDDQSIELLITASVPLDREYLNKIHKAIEQRVGKLPIAIKLVPEIPRNKSTDKVKAFESLYFRKIRQQD